MKTFNRKQKVIIILGAPGSGKGTQGELLSEKFSLYYFETSKILEEAFNQDSKKQSKPIEIDGKNYCTKKEKKLWETGMLCSPPWVTHLVSQRIKELHKDGKSLLLSGSPRTLYEGEKLMPLLKKLYGINNIYIILIEQSAETSIFRNSHRRICELMRHPILYSEETAKLKKCPIDGSRLLKRKGLDNPATIKTRLKEYEERTLPLIDLFKQEKIKIKTINGEEPPADVFAAILKALQS